MARHLIRFGRLVKNVSNVILPLDKSAKMSNINIDTSGTAVRRPGYQRALSVDFASPIYLHSKFQDIDGTDVYIVITDDGVNRTES